MAVVGLICGIWGEYLQFGVKFFQIICLACRNLSLLLYEFFTFVSETVNKQW